MKILFDFFPIIIFFTFYKLYGIMLATSSAIITSLIQIIYLKIKYKKIPKTHLISFYSILILGGATLLLKDEMFIKWKPSIVYWILALVFLCSHFIGKGPIIKNLANGSIDLPEKIWNNLNISWTIFFTILGLLNIYIVYNFSTDVWVNFKLFGTLGLTILFTIIQVIFIHKHISTKNDNF